MRIYGVYACMVAILLSLSTVSMAENQWGNYRSVERPKPPSRPPQWNRPPPPYYGHRPPSNGHYPHYPQRPHQGVILNITTSPILSMSIELSAMYLFVAILYLSNIVMNNIISMTGMDISLMSQHGELAGIQ